MTEEQRDSLIAYYFHMKDLHEVSDHHSPIKSYYEGEVAGIEGTLRKLGITIEGINA